jgi:hypothetical protein
MSDTRVDVLDNSSAAYKQKIEMYVFTYSIIAALAIEYGIEDINGLWSSLKGAFRTALSIASTVATVTMQIIPIILDNLDENNPNVARVRVLER